MILPLLLWLVGFPPASHPSPRGTSAAPTTANQPVKQQTANKDDNSFSSKPAIPQTQSISDHPGRDDQTGKDREYQVKLTGLPAVSVIGRTKTLWDRVFEWGPWIANLLLVVVGGLQAFYVAKTLDAIRRQTKIQVASLRPWFRLGKSTANSQGPVASLAGTAEKLDVSLAYEIINPTSSPIRLQSIRWFVSTHKVDLISAWKDAGEDIRERMIPPHKDGGSPLQSYAEMRIEGIQSVEQFRRNQLLIQVRGEVCYYGIEGEPQIQTFPHFALCGENHLMRLGILGGEDFPNQTTDNYDPT